MASVDFFLDIPGIEGESIDGKMKGKLDLTSWSWGETQSGTHGSGGGGGAGKVAQQDFHFVKKLDKASPLLAQSCATGKHYAKASLLCRKAGGNQMVYYQVDFNDVLISSYQIGASSGGGDVTPTEQISLNFTKALWIYTPQDAKGVPGSAQKKGYDYGKNASF